MTMAKNLLENNKNVGAYAAVALVLLVAVFVATQNHAPQANNAVATPTVLASAVPSILPTITCANGVQKEFACVGSISGTQTYYECVNGAWESKSRYNYSECVKTFGPNETNMGEPITSNASNATNATATPAINSTVTPVPSVFPSATPIANASKPGFVNMTVKNIRTNTAELYWFTNANATGTVHYGTEPGVRRWILAAQFPAFSQYQELLYIAPNTTYYFEVEMCANGTCVKTPTLNFSTPQVDSYFVGDTTVPYPGGQANFTAAQLNPK